MKKTLLLLLLMVSVFVNAQNVSLSGPPQLKLYAVKGNPSGILNANVGELALEQNNGVGSLWQKIAATGANNGWVNIINSSTQSNLWTAGAGNTLYPTNVGSNVGIGTSTPTSSLSVAGNANFNYANGRLNFLFGTGLGATSVAAFTSVSGLYFYVLTGQAGDGFVFHDSTGSGFKVQGSVINGTATDSIGLYCGRTFHLDASDSGRISAANIFLGGDNESAEVDIFIGGTGAGSINVLQAQTGINTITPHASATLDIESTTQGILFPQMTTTQKNAISSPKEGLMVYDLTLHAPFFFNGTIWVAF